ncbi:MAG: tetratricopeptide repeat protein, partial [Kiloniellales bacterium]|nr:tetratricopeptide repeat protein [Kiloniellales bacterium]
MKETARLHIKRKLLFALGLASWALVPAACVAQTAGEVDKTSNAAMAGEAAPIIESPYGAYLAGLSAMRAHDLSTAADYMATALLGAPNDPEVLNQAFLLMSGEGRFEEAVALADRVLAVDGDNLAANLLLATIAAGDGGWEEAAARLDAMPQRGLGSLLKPLYGAWVEFGRGNSVEAKRLLDEDVTNAGIEFLRYLHEALMAELADDDEAASIAYEAALKSASTPPLRLAWLAGSFYERQGRHEDAAALYRRFIEEGRGATIMAPLLARAEAGGEAASSIDGVQEGIAEVLFNFSSLLNQERASDLALLTIRMALHLRPDFPVAQVLLGEILQDQDRSAAAIQAYREIPEKSPFSTIVRLRIAEELERLDAVDEALTELDQLAEDLPGEYEPYYRKGNLLREHERFEEAVAAYDLAMERLGEPAPRHWSLLYFRGVALERSQQWERAEADFLKALELEPEQPFVMNYLAYSWVEQKRNLDEAK